MIMTVESMIREAAALDREIKTKTERLRELKEKLAGLVTFEDGKKTGRLVGAGHVVKVQLRENVSWDQSKLETARQAIGNDDFFRPFSWKFEPASKKALDAFLEYHPKADLVKQAMTVKDGSPQVTFESIEDEAAAPIKTRRGKLEVVHNAA
jgi:predicted transcriptional regulator